MAKLKYQRPKGTIDILPEDQVYWDKIREALRKVAKYYSFKRIDTPIIEPDNLFIKSIGISSDIVDQKEMFKLKTKGGDGLTLRPEGTAPIARAYIENGMRNRRHPLRFYYIGPMFRHEKPQHNRLRQFHQFGFEVIGSQEPVTDAHIIQLAFIIFKELSIDDLTLHINSIGCHECRPSYIKELKAFLSPQLRKLSSDQRKKIQANPLRLFDSKDEKCQRIAKEAPQIIDSLCDKCRKDFEKLLEFLDFLDIPYVFNPYMVRGLDYYNGAVYEILPQGKEYETKEALGGGGRYDYLIESLGGRETSATGAAFGIERLINFLKEKEKASKVKKKPENRIFLAHLGDFGQKCALKLMEDLRKENLNIVDAFSRKTMKLQKKAAEKFGARLMVIVTQKEAMENSVILRDRIAGTQEVVLIKELSKKIKMAFRKQGKKNVANRKKKRKIIKKASPKKKPKKSKPKKRKKKK